ncbi:MAG: type I-C CRISPR-associated endonuclease Cas1 [Deltaproteobacteria bacterium]|nr:type I-C CRISPR-associated endonuclease Cas1 [Deltaproteobacteria bacterium]
MRQLENTLFVMTQGAYMRLEHDTLKVEVEGDTKLQVPLHHLGGLVCMGNVMVSPFLLHKCAEDGRSINWLSRTGQFKGRLTGPTKGNVLLRRAQYEASLNEQKSLSIARNMVAGKIKNARQLLLRGARETKAQSDADEIRGAAEKLGRTIQLVQTCENVDNLRGLEGEAARDYFNVFDRLIRENREDFKFETRSRRPPRDRINAVLSFLYTLLLNDVIAALEGVGLDPQSGFLHALRPGRPALGLDLMEEFRPVLADRLAVTLINQRQIQSRNFEEKPGGAVLLDENGRKTVVEAYQKRKQDEVNHTLLETKIPFALIPHAQARLLARHLRGDVQEYIPFTYR